MRSIQNAESEVTFTLGKTFQWFTGAVAAPTVVYYAYAGSYEDEETGQVYYCSTTIIYPPALVGPISISTNQVILFLFLTIVFEIFFTTVRISSIIQFTTTFLSLKNKNGKPFSNQVKQYPRVVPVIQARGVYQYLVPK